MSNTVKKHTLGTSITARQLQIDNIPRNDLHRLLHASRFVALMVEDGRIRPTVEDDPDTEEALTALAELFDEFWLKFGQPAPVDPEFVNFPGLPAPDVVEAMATAQRLLDLHGEDDPRAMAAIIRAVNLADPGLTDKILEECGIHLPTATHVNDAGEPVFSVDQIAQALNVDPDDVAEKVAEMADALVQPLEPSSPRRIQ